MKPAKPFEIQRGADHPSGEAYAIVRRGFIVGWDNWEGTGFRTREAAQCVIDMNGSGAKVVEVLDQISVRL